MSKNSLTQSVRKLYPAAPGASATPGIEPFDDSKLDRLLGKTQPNHSTGEKNLTQCISLKAEDRRIIRALRNYLEEEGVETGISVSGIIRAALHAAKPNKEFLETYLQMK